MKTQHRHLILLLAFVCCLLGWENEVKAANIYTKTFTENATVVFTQVSGTTKFKVSGDANEYDAIGRIILNTDGIVVKFKFNSGTFYMSSRMDVLLGRLQILANGDNAVTLKRTSYDCISFLVSNTTTAGVNATRLDIIGASDSKRISIDGNAVWSVTGNNADGYTATKTSGVEVSNPLVYMRAGRGYFQYVNFQNVWTTTATQTGGAFRVVSVAGSGGSTSRNYVEIDHCTIKKCYSKGLGAAMHLGGPMITTANSEVIMTNTTTEDCFCAAEVDGDGGGIYRTGGNGTANLSMTNCTLQNNKSNSTGVIMWNAGEAALSLSGCTFKNNYTKTSGGALTIYSKATITNCTIKGNYAVSHGGGIYYSTYSNSTTSMPNYQPQNGSLDIDATTEISGNTSKANGGGLYVLIRPINCKNGSTYYTVFENSSNTQYEVHLNINGTTIKDNTAGENGGGVYLQRSTDIYKSDLNFNYGTIENNTANSSSGNGGGGIYVTSNLNGEVHGTCPYSPTNLAVNVGKSGTSPKANVWKNKANNGGGIYTGGYKIVFIVYANAVIGKSSYANQATATSGKGGGVYFNGEQTNSTYGTFTMEGGNIDYNTSKGDGAGVYIANGTCTFKGGSITNNQSESGNGGGFYVNPGGDGAPTAINSTSANLSISSNEAINGGGIYVNQGSLTITKSGSNTLQINSNTAKTANTGHGGGIYAKGTVTVSGATISSNHAEGNCGGGIFAASGSSITVNSSAAITSNTAIDGAGLYAAGGDITITSSEVSSNTASRNGGGLYVTGSATINSGTVIKSNTGSTNGGGVYVNNGTFTMNAGTIGGSGTPNTATDGNGGGVYVTGGNAKVDIKGGAISYNTAPSTTTNNGRGGGIYVASTGDDGTSLSGGATVNNNTARQYGGGVFVVSGNFTLSNGIISANTATANDGGGVYLGGGTFTLNNASGIIKSNTAHTNGGGVYVSNATFTMTNGTIGGEGTPNTATYGNGGGVYVTGSSAKVDIKGGAISYNTAPSTTSTNGRGGGIYVASTGSDGTSVSGGASVNNNTAQQCGGGVYVVSGKFTLSNGTISSNTATANDGGGVYLGNGNFYLNNASGVINDNKASSGNGGGVYLAGGTFHHSGGSIGSLFASPNKAVNGGGLYVYSGTYNSTSTSAAIIGNEATGKGGGIYMNGGTCNMKGGHIGDNGGTQLNKAANGGGVYMAGSGTFNMTDAAAANSYIRGNQATTSGGGIYMEGGTCTVTYGTIGASGKPNTAVNGGGIFANGGTITVNGGDVNYNSATYGGGIYANTSSTVDVTSGDINNNTASTSGGGLFVKGTVNFSNGNINNNTATTANGGGVYIDATGELNVSGSAVMTANSVPSGQGGGVYQGGTMTADGNSLTISGNTMGSAKTTSKNNVYLPASQTIKVLENIDPAEVNLGIYTENVATQNDHTTDIPVLSADLSDVSQLEEIYEALQNGNSRIIDDRHLHKPRYVTNETILYFTRLSYDYEAYTSDFSGDIDGLPQLYKYMCWVNGINGFEDEGPHPGWTGNLTADINMGEILHWVPIGENELGQTGTDPFQGTFNGNGHVIKNLTVDATSGYTNYGLFGQTKGATISNVFMEGFDFAKSSDAGTLGSIVGLMEGGSLSGSSASGSLTTTATGCVTGGLVGKVEKNGDAAATIHSSSAMAEMTGYQMGGLVGSLATGCNLYNSFANPKFTYSGSDDSYFAGGLAAVNNGTVQNCYVRFTRVSSLGSVKFGQIVGDNNGSVMVCYHPTTYDASISSALVNDGSVTSTIYGDVVAPYLYYHSNDNLVGSTTETLCNKLNDWVTTNNSTPGQPTCAEWKRTTAGGTAYSATAGDINGDYPIHKYSDYTCVASTDGITLDYAANLDAMLTRHTSNATINLYANDNTSMSTGSNVAVYIDEDICLLQDVGADTPSSNITAYTCQTIPGSPRSWHFVSSSLSNSGIGFTYGQDAPFNWEPNPCLVTISDDDDASLFPSDLPDVSKIDLYCFYEPEYHWINLKRNSNSHWHMNATTAQITYPNETTLTPGKGYLISIDQDQLLQNKGTLNNGEVEVGLGYTPDQAWAGLLGYNLIGNPYQSYLDFSAFASQNNTLWYDASKGREVEPTYAVYDDAMGGYIQYKQGASRGARTASGTLNMHQGFMVRSSGATRAKFTNAMRTDDGTGVSFRGEQPAFPLINLTVTDSEGVNDFAVLELGRDTDAGAEKLRANDCKGWLYLHHNGDDYGILFRSEVDGYQPLWFEAEEAGTYTLEWETANGEFESLTLVDNITGVVTDMLATDSYTFEANSDQYKSRFKIVIGDYKDIEENEGGASTGSEADEIFAYYANGEIHLVETQNFASLQIVDMTGRVILSRDGVHTISTNGIVPGVYVLRLTTDKGTKIQKMVIE